MKRELRPAEKRKFRLAKRRAADADPAVFERRILQQIVDGVTIRSNCVPGSPAAEVFEMLAANETQHVRFADAQLASDKLARRWQ